MYSFDQNAGVKLENGGPTSSPSLGVPSDHKTAVTATVTAAAPKVRRRNRMITSCLECRRRKLKCDKQQPCTNCAKSSRDCFFLAPSLDSASQLKLTEIKEKMGSLERVLEQDVARNGAWREARKAHAAGERSMEDEIDFAPIPEDERELEPSPMATMDAVYEDDADDDTLDLGIKLGKLRLTDRLGGFFRPKMADELNFSLTDTRNDRRSEAEKIASPTPSIRYARREEDPFAPGATYIPPSSNFFFATNTAGASLIDFLPAKSAADHLLQQYWLAVHPMCRLVHRPSFQRRYDFFWDQIRMGMEPVGSLQAVVFAALFSGVVSMPDDQIFTSFAVSKRDLVENFQQGAETALSRANLLRTTKVETMQAFVMYLIPLCRDQVSRAHSALVGTAIRLAECMGLHRDGSAYGLSAVEVHVRRLIWHQISYLDIRTCEAQGPRPGIRAGDFDTKLPLNIDDNDLEATAPPKEDAQRWTDMTLTLIRFEANDMMRTLWVDRPKLETKELALTTVLGKIENFRRMLYSKYGPILDTTEPIHQVASLVMSVLCNRLMIMVLHRYHNGVASRMPDRLRQMILTSGTVQIEASMRLETLPSLQTWAWYSGALHQYQTAFLLLAELFTYPNRREADRIWKVLDYVFEVPSELPRDERARVILTEIRDKLNAYRVARKLKAPPSMMRRVVDPPPRTRQHLDANDALALPFTAAELALNPDLHPTVGNAQIPGLINHEQSSMEGELYFPAPGGELKTHIASMLGPKEIDDSTRGSISGATVSSEGAATIIDDMMADIDWNEWDKLFPDGFVAPELGNAPPYIPGATPGLFYG